MSFSFDWRILIRRTLHAIGYHNKYEQRNARLFISEKICFLLDISKLCYAFCLSVDVKNNLNCSTCLCNLFSVGTQVYKMFFLTTKLLHIYVVVYNTSQVSTQDQNRRWWEMARDFWLQNKMLSYTTRPIALPIQLFYNSCRIQCYLFIYHE